MPFLLPDSVPDPTPLAYAIVAYPNLDELRRAALGQLADLTKWYNWERDAAHTGKECARAWRDAERETLRLLEMGFPDLLLGYIDEVETLLTQLLAAQASVGCCPTTGDAVSSTTDSTTDAVPTAIQTEYSTGNDWSQYETLYLCPALRTMWDGLAAGVFDPIADLLNLGGLGIATLTAIYVGWAGIAGVVIAGLEIGAAVALLKDLLTAGSSLALGNYETDLAALRDDWICEITGATTAEGMKTLSDAFIDATSLNALVKLILKTSLNQNWFNTIWEGSDSDGNVVQHDGSSGCPTCGYALNFDPLALTSVVSPYTQPSGSHTVRGEAVLNVGYNGIVWTTVDTLTIATVAQVIGYVVKVTEMSRVCQSAPCALWTNYHTLLSAASGLSLAVADAHPQGTLYVESARVTDPDIVAYAAANNLDIVSSGSDYGGGAVTAGFDVEGASENYLGTFEIEVYLVWDPTL